MDLPPNPNRMAALNELYKADSCLKLTKILTNKGPIEMYKRMHTIISWRDFDSVELVYFMFIRISFIELGSYAIEFLSDLFMKFEFIAVERKPGERSSDEINLNGMVILKFSKEGYIFETSLENILKNIAQLNLTIRPHEFRYLVAALLKIEKLIPEEIIGPINRWLNIIRYNKRLLINPPEDIKTNPKYTKFSFTEDKPNLQHNENTTWIDSVWYNENFDPSKIKFVAPPIEF